jgi:predicted ester cyclase
MSVESTRAVLHRYFEANHDDTSMLADDVVFTVMGTGQEAHTPQGVVAMLDYFYHVAFEAGASTRNLVIEDGKAVLEADFKGRHTGEFAGIAPTGKDVTVPLCVCYDVEGDKIKRARIYFETDALRAQLGG